MAWRTDKALFYAIPKTGSTWVTEATRAAGLRPHYCRTTGEARSMGLSFKHAPPTHVGDRYKKGRFQFCFVRHPVGWYRSMWAWRMRKDKPFTDVLGQAGWSDDFETWVRMVLDAWPKGFVSQMYRQFTPHVDFVGRQENLEDGLVYALRQAGETFDEDALRATPPQLVRAGDPRWEPLCKGTPELVERIEAVEAWTMERFYEGDK